MLSQLIYTSTVQDLPGGIEKILDQSRRNNEARDLTGALVVSEQYFLQILEGGREQVTAAFCRIAPDKRHANVSLTSVRDIDERDFPDWTMGYLGLTASRRAVLHRFQPNAGFAPHLLSPHAALAMIRTLRDADLTV